MNVTEPTILDVSELTERARQTLKITQQYGELRIQIRALCPGFDLLIVKTSNEHQPDLMPIQSASKEESEFCNLTGMEQIEYMLKKMGPLEKPKLLAEIHRLGGTMSLDSLGTYLNRGKVRRTFKSFGDRIWGLSEDFIDDPLHVNGKEASTS